METIAITRAAVTNPDPVSCPFEASIFCLALLAITSAMIPVTTPQTKIPTSATTNAPIAVPSVRGAYSYPGPPYAPAP